MCIRDRLRRGTGGRRRVPVRHGDQEQRPGNDLRRNAENAAFCPLVHAGKQRHFHRSDVYKRQAFSRAGDGSHPAGQGCPCDGIPVRIHQNSVGSPVSYTHLDVYKRQPIRPLFWTPASPSTWHCPEPRTTGKGFTSGTWWGWKALP